MSSLINRYITPTEGANNTNTTTNSNNNNKADATTTNAEETPTNTPDQGAGETIGQFRAGKAVTQEQICDLAKNIVAKGQDSFVRQTDDGSPAELGGGFARGGGKKTAAAAAAVPTTDRDGKSLGSKGGAVGAEGVDGDIAEEGEGEEGEGEGRKGAAARFGVDDAQKLTRSKTGASNEQQQQQKFAGGNTKPVTRRTGGLAETNVDDGHVGR